MTSRRLMVGILVCMAAVLAPCSAAANPNVTTSLLWPLPSNLTFGTGYFTLDPDLFKFMPSGPGASSSTLLGALDRYYKIIFDTPVPFYPGGDPGTSMGTLSEVYVDVASSDESLGPDTNETYTVTIGTGTSSVSSATVYGALRALETFGQLVYRTPEGGYAVSAVTLVDIPRFTYRGSMIDSSRHYLTLNTILAHLDAMSYSKFNVLHWHITDDQSFPYQSTVLPQLSGKGAYDRNHVYSQEVIQEVIEYARQRGIRVIVEFDTPGHTLSWGKGIPELLTACYDSSGKPDGKYGPINPVVNTTWEYLDKFFTEVAAVFPDPYLHLGGDEVSFSCWESNPVIQQWMKEHGYTDYSKVEQYYETTLLNFVAGLNKQYIVWQEIFDNGLKVLPNTVIDVWKGGWEDEMKRVTAGGLHAILSTCWYLNYISYGADWTKYYQCDPQNFNGTKEEQELVVGGHCCLWGEYVDSSNFLSRYWPRAGAVGERLWSPASVTDVNDAGVRLHNFRCRMISRGIPAEPPDGPSFCTTEWNGIIPPS